MAAGAALSNEEIARLLESTCALIEAEMNALGDEGCRWHARDGEWCVNECVGHLIEAEKRGFAGRIRDLIAGKPIQSWDQAQVARDRRDCDRVSQSLWMEFMGLRNDSIALVRSLKPADMEKGGMHPKVGELKVRWLLQEWISHDRNHTKQLLSIAMERVWPHMGNAQKFKGE